MKHQLLIKRIETPKWKPLLVPQSSEDNYLTQLASYLFEHRGDIPYIVKTLSNEAIQAYGGKLMYSRMLGSTVFIYDNTDDYDKQGELGIGINRANLIEILKAWLELNNLIKPHNGVKEITLQRDEEHINMTALYEDESKFKKIFNYKCNQEELKAIKEYFE